ncbi:protein-tyrosine-phosphatase, partial [Lactobacillus acidophilus]
IYYGLTKIIYLLSPFEFKKAPYSQIPGVEHIDLSISTEDNTKGGKKDITKVFETYRKYQYDRFNMMCDRYRSHVMK